MRKRIVRELQIMHGCHSDYIVTFYGAFLNENNDVIMCMEYMDVGYVAYQGRTQRCMASADLGQIAPSTVSRACSALSG
jgi:mitogen-activated protein kinase kinase